MYDTIQSGSEAKYLSDHSRNVIFNRQGSFLNYIILNELYYTIKFINLEV